MLLEMISQGLGEGVDAMLGLSQINVTAHLLLVPLMGAQTGVGNCCSW
jgi:hypothetical protein